MSNSEQENEKTVGKCSPALHENSRYSDGISMDVEAARKSRKAIDGSRKSLQSRFHSCAIYRLIFQVKCSMNEL
jgi:hypothetical protein